ncbi:hypothetical protein ACHQM5_020010 [Ranunculus cassubicifolius]
MLHQELLASLPSTSNPISSFLFNKTPHFSATLPTIHNVKTLKFHERTLQCCNARRRVRYEEDDEYTNEEYGHNSDIDLLESYSETARNEALLVRAMVDNQEEEILIFKGFSSCLSYRTSSDPSRSILPARAVITSIDRVVGPFHPSNIEYIEKGLTWDTFKDRLQD